MGAIRTIVIAGLFAFWIIFAVIMAILTTRDTLRQRHESHRHHPPRTSLITARTSCPGSFFAQRTSNPFAATARAIASMMAFIS